MVHQDNQIERARAFAQRTCATHAHGRTCVKWRTQGCPGSAPTLKRRMMVSCPLDRNRVARSLWVPSSRHVNLAGRAGAGFLCSVRTANSADGCRQRDARTKPLPSSVVAGHAPQGMQQGVRLALRVRLQDGRWPQPSPARSAAALVTRPGGGARWRPPDAVRLAPLGVFRQAPARCPGEEESGHLEFGFWQGWGAGSARASCVQFASERPPHQRQCQRAPEGSVS